LIKNKLIAALILNAIIIIVIPSGHGGGPLIMLEFFSLPLILENGIKIKSEHPFESYILLIILISLIGKIIVIFNLFSKEIIKSKKYIYFGLSVMLIAFTCILISILKYAPIIPLITLGSGIPFLIYCYKSVRLINKK